MTLKSLSDLEYPEDTPLLHKSVRVMSGPLRASATDCEPPDAWRLRSCRPAWSTAGNARPRRISMRLSWSPHKRWLGDLESSEATELLLKNVSVVSSPFRAAAAHCAADFLRGRLRLSSAWQIRSCRPAWLLRGRQCGKTRMI